MSVGVWYYGCVMLTSGQGPGKGGQMFKLYNSMTATITIEGDLVVPGVCEGVSIKSLGFEGSITLHADGSASATTINGEHFTVMGLSDARLAIEGHSAWFHYSTEKGWVII